MNTKGSAPNFSVIIPTYNREDFINSAIDSVWGQTFSDFDLIVIDDGSTDRTRESVEEYQDSRLRYFYQNNKGVSSARNRGIKESKGKYLAFLDSDDTWVDTKLERTAEYIKKFPDT